MTGSWPFSGVILSRSVNVQKIAGVYLGAGWGVAIIGLRAGLQQDLPGGAGREAKAEPGRYAASDDPTR